MPTITKSQFIFYLLWPFGALIYALKNYRNPSSKTVFWLFCIYFGYVFIYATPYEKGTADSSRYAEDLIELHNDSPSFNEFTKTLYNKETRILDLYQPLSTYFISLLTDNPRILFMLFALVFGFFYTQNLWLVLNAIDKKIGWILFLLLLAFILTNPIWQINGVRMWTAAQIFLYGILKFFLTKNKKGLIWCGISVLVHFSFLFPVGILITWFILPKKVPLIYFLFFIITAFFVEIKLTLVKEWLSFLPELFQHRVESYTAESGAIKRLKNAQQVSWHVTWAGSFFRWFLYIWVTAIFFRGKEWMRNHPNTLRLFLFGLLLGGFANLSSQVPSGGRFMTLANGFFLAVLILVNGNKTINLKLNILYYLTIPFLIFIIVFKFRVGFNYIGILIIAGNPVTSPFLETQIPLIDFVKQLFQ